MIGSDNIGELLIWTFGTAQCRTGNIPAATHSGKTQAMPPATQCPVAVAGFSRGDAGSRPLYAVGARGERPGPRWTATCRNTASLSWRVWHWAQRATPAPHPLTFSWLVDGRG